MRWARRDKESAESILVVSESVSNRRRVTRPVKSAASGCGRRPEPKKRKQPEVICEQSCDTLRGEPIGPVRCAPGLVAFGSEPQQTKEFLNYGSSEFASNTENK